MRSDVDLSLANPTADAKGEFGLDPCLHLAGDFRALLILSRRRRNDTHLLRRRRTFSFVFAGSQNCAGETNSQQSKGLHVFLRYGLQSGPALLIGRLQSVACNRPSPDVDNAHLKAKVGDVNILAEEC
jgi:hypothetical protein